MQVNLIWEGCNRLQFMGLLLSFFDFFLLVSSRPRVKILNRGASRATFGGGGGSQEGLGSCRLHWICSFRKGRLRFLIIPTQSDTCGVRASLATLSLPPYFVQTSGGFPVGEGGSKACNKHQNINLRCFFKIFINRSS